MQTRTRKAVAVRKLFTVERKHPNGRFRPIRGLVCSTRRKARTYLEMVRANWLDHGCPEPVLRVKAVQQ